MTDLTKSNPTQLTQTLKEKLQAIKAGAKHTLLIDLSGSMYDYVGEKSKREIVEEIVSKLPQNQKKYAFSGTCEKIEGNHFPEMGGSTRLAEAFEVIKADGIREIVLLTDGEPDSEKRALDAARGLKIEIIYIGPEPRPKFLEDLARSAGGSFITVDMLKSSAPLELENKIKGLLGK